MKLVEAKDICPIVLSGDFIVLSLSQGYGKQACKMNLSISLDRNMCIEIIYNNDINSYTFALEFRVRQNTWN